MHLSLRKNEVKYLVSSIEVWSYKWIYQFVSKTVLVPLYRIFSRKFNIGRVQASMRMQATCNQHKAENAKQAADYKFGVQPQNLK